jgi:hypothetical protein
LRSNLLALHVDTNCGYPGAGTCRKVTLARDESVHIGRRGVPARTDLAPLQFEVQARPQSGG